MIDFQNTEYFTHAITIGGKILEVPLRKGKKDAAFIDALTFTVHKRTIENAKGLTGGEQNKTQNSRARNTQKKHIQD